jgi:glycosyltransferase involved in cell wall biosynthesis
LPSPSLRVSVIVNTVDRAAALATLLSALEHQSYPLFEVIVVVGPTRDETLAVLAPYAGRLRALHCPHANLSESRNIGLLAARGEIVAFIDDDAVPSYHWLAQIVDTFAATEAAGHDIAVVGGSVYMVHPNQPTIQHWLGIMSDLGEAYDVRQGAEHDDRARPEGMGIFWTERPMGANMAFRRAALVAVGGFDTYYQWVFDDADIAMRLALAGYGVRSLTEAPVYHVPASSRNRVVRTFTGRWWIITQASTYFAVQNGRAARQPVSQVVLRVLHLIHGAWLVNGELYRAGYISRRDMWARRLHAMTAGARGAVDGLGRRRLLGHMPEPVPQPGTDQVQPFPVPSGQDVPGVDPIDGTRGKGPLARPPLRIGLLARPFIAHGPPFVPDQLAAVTQALFAMGHTVHVLAAADQRTIVFQSGAYIHLELHQPGSELLLTGLRRLLENDGIQWLVGAPEDLAAAAAAHLVVADPAVPVSEAAQPAGPQRAASLSVPGNSSDLLPENVRHAVGPLLASGCAAAPTAQLSSVHWSLP